MEVVLQGRSCILVSDLVFFLKKARANLYMIARRIFNFSAS